jgi:protease PrsW
MPNMLNPFRAWAAFVADPHHDSLFTGSPLRQPRIGAYINAALFVLLAVAILIQLGQIAELRREGTAGVFFKALALSSLLSAVPIALLWFLDRRERESPSLFAAAFIWGACIATAIAMPFNTAFYNIVDHWVRTHPAIEQLLGPDTVMLLAAPISGPIAEEIAKALGVLALFWLLRAEFDGMRDGLVYGALIGVGFNWIEAASYVAQDFAQSGKATYGAQLGGRYALLGLSGHTLFTALFGASLGLAAQTRRRWLRILAPIVGLLLAIGAHMINNAQSLLAALSDAREGRRPEAEAVSDMGFLAAMTGSSFAETMMFWPFILIVAMAVWRSGVWERQVIREELVGEVGGVINAAEYQEIVGDGTFHTNRIDRKRRRISAALVNAENELAFRKRSVRDEGKDPESDPLVALWRGNISRLRSAS